MSVVVTLPGCTDIENHLRVAIMTSQVSSSAFVLKSRWRKLDNIGSSSHNSLRIKLPLCAPMPKLNVNDRTNAAFPTEWSKVSKHIFVYSVWGAGGKTMIALYNTRSASTCSEWLARQSDMSVLVEQNKVICATISAGICVITYQFFR